MERIGIVISYYNTGHETNEWVEFIHNNFRTNYKLIVVNNGSKPEFSSHYDDVIFKENVNKLGGVLAGMEKFKSYDPTIYWNISTSTKMNPMTLDPSQILLDTLLSTPNAVAITPGYVGEVIDKTNQANLAINGSESHESYLAGAYSMFDAEWLKSIGGFTKELTSTWGIDFELSYLARQQNKKFLVHDIIRYNVLKGPAYVSGVADKTLDQYQDECRAEMNLVLAHKYGANWAEVLGVTEYV